MRYCWIFVLTGIIIFTSCHNTGQQQKGKPLAKVWDIYLYDTDLKDVVPAGTSKKDSVDMVKNYIQNWIRQQLVVHQADQNLSRDQKNFTRELEEYRNSLLVYQYESILVNQKLDTVVTDKEMEDYYYANPSNFELKDNIVKVLYVKMQLNDANVSKIRNVIRSNSKDNKQKLSQLAAQYAVNSYLDDNSWLFFNDLLKEIPIKTYNQEEYLQNHRFVEFSDEQYTYLLNIVDFKIKEGLSPFNLEKENIRNIVINKRKIKLINDMEKEVYEQALKNKDFVIF
jgi:hypothetical protein